MKKALAVKSVAKPTIVNNTRISNKTATQITYNAYKTLCYHNGIRACMPSYNRIVNAMYAKFGKQQSADMIQPWFTSKMPAEMIKFWTPTAEDEKQVSAYWDGVKSAKDAGRAFNPQSLEELHDLLRTEINNGADKALVKELGHAYINSIVNILADEHSKVLDKSARQEIATPTMPEIANTTPTMSDKELLMSLLAKMLK